MESWGFALPEILASAWLAFAFIVPVLLVLAQRALLDPRRSASPADAANAEPVSVLRPVCGLDADFEANLATLFRQDHAEYEVLIGAADADDPALDAARRVAAEHPRVPCRVVADARRTGVNAKANNLANLARHARHALVVVSDSNVSVPADYLSGIAAHLRATGAGLSSSPIAARPGKTLGAALESLQINTYVMGGVAAITLWARGVCCVGKSMAFRRDDLDRLGGFPMLARHIAEDQVCGEAFAQAGLGATVAVRPVVNVLGPITVREFCLRHLRWARLRRWMSPAGYAAEILANPMAAALAALALLPLPVAAAGAAAALLLRAACDGEMERRVGVRRSFAARTGLLLLKESLLVALWPVPFLGRTLTWRGRRYRLGPRTVAELLPPRSSRTLRSAPAASPAILADLVLDGDADGDPVAATA